MLTKLKGLRKSLTELKLEISAEQKKQISKKDLRDKAETLGTNWFAEFTEPLLSMPSMSQELVEHYSHWFGRLVKISRPNNLRKTYLEILDNLTKSFDDDLILPMQTKAGTVRKDSLLEKLLQDLSNPDECIYLSEAAECARHGFYRAAANLGWCAAIDRIHRSIEKGGFRKFNSTSAAMASSTTGRYKRYNQVQHVKSISDLREVFDNVILWIIEGMGMVDSNQRARLKSCFDLRCQCSHPGDAPITEYNLLSFFSDINEIVLRNDTFKV